MAYDRARGEAVLFGGTDGWTWFNDTWIGSSQTLQWIEKFPAHVPEGRYDHAVVYDGARGAVVLFGGVKNAIPGYLNDTWLWTGEDWQEVVTAAASPLSFLFVHPPILPGCGIISVMEESSRTDIRRLLKTFGVRADEAIISHLARNPDGGPLRLRLVLQDLTNYGDDAPDTILQLEVEGEIRR